MRTAANTTTTSSVVYSLHSQPGYRAIFLSEAKVNYV